MFLHVNIKPIKAKVKSKFLYDMDQSKKGNYKCTIIGLSSYQGHMLTCRILVNGGIFDYIPIFALSTDKMFSYEFNCVYMNCPDKEFSFEKIKHIKKNIKKITISIKNENGKFEKIKVNKYLGTIDWYNKNENAHLFISKGALYLVPNYRMLIKTKTFPDFKKINSEWKLIN